MPTITIDTAKLSKEQKAQIVKEMTKTASAVTGLDESLFSVFIREYDFDNIGTGGVLLSDKMPR